MPAINIFGCNRCDFSLPPGWGGIMYVADNDGGRVACRHPGEMGTVCSVIGYKPTDEEYKERTGFLSDCFCADCMHQFKLDLKRDQRICEKCCSANVKSTNESIGSPCPKCKDGTITETDVGIMC